MFDHCLKTRRDHTPAYLHRCEGLPSDARRAGSGEFPLTSKCFNFHDTFLANNGGGPVEGALVNVAFSDK